MGKIKAFLIVLTSLVLLLGTTVVGWYFGYRDGVTYAYSDMAGSLVTYHLAHERQDREIEHRAINRYTGEVVAHLLNGRYAFPPTPLAIASRSESSLSQLRAVWTPEPKFRFRTIYQVICRRNHWTSLPGYLLVSPPPNP